ncbi:MAG: hypothetical protein IJ880_11325 [Bacilli bacterium]|nr:hypothetical protein [Bacilli bacterium]
MKKKKDNLPVVERKTTIEIPAKQRPGCTVGLKPIFWTILWCALVSIAVKECKRADIRLQEEKIKLEHMKDGTVVDSTPAIKPDTLKIGSFQKEYIPLLKLNQRSK